MYDVTRPVLSTLPSFLTRTLESCLRFLAMRFTSRSTLSTCLPTSIVTGAASVAVAPCLGGAKCLWIRGPITYIGTVLLSLKYSCQSTSQEGGLRYSFVADPPECGHATQLTSKHLRTPTLKEHSPAGGLYRPAIDVSVVSKRLPVPLLYHVLLLLLAAVWYANVCAGATED